ncbi:MAG: hypothetical protein MK137_04085 [Rickettsiales bacterium]|nr:hypothetical protein [Rickettsiales bacterium]
MALLIDMNSNPTVLKLLLRSWIIVFIPIGIISLLVLIWATRIAIDELDLKQNGIEIYGNVIDKWEDEEWERNLIEYEFSHNDIIYAKASSVSYKIYKKTHVGDQIVVLGSVVIF